MILSPSDRIVILTGAAISRNPDWTPSVALAAYWNASGWRMSRRPRGSSAIPIFVHQFYNDRRSGLLKDDIQPNAAHAALAKLEREWPGEAMLLVTQNIDDLHERGR